MRTYRLLIVLAASALLAAGCGDKKDSGGSASGSCDVSVSGDQGKKPQVSVPKCAAPTALQTKDLITGSGDAVRAGDTVAVNYTLYTWSDGKSVESSYDSGQSFPVENVGQAQVIDGWNKGLVGLRKGGRRLLVVPPSLGYGAQGSGPIGPNETLVFVIDAVNLTPSGKLGPSTGG